MIVARAMELAFLYSKAVWQKVPKAHTRAVAGRPAISVRWFDANKGDDLCPNYRPRLLGKLRLETIPVKAISPLHRPLRLSGLSSA